ncbi:hypothetical protein PR003_g5467 [Phytophthora rubi]|uniref:Uncharacterized protein n=1 Tax=Phytophthora rubi TaxID=129364 RepID=A0A6A4FSP1_9STRA|nr:hypothetical protein PR003_g5467 [Phytophthora rubi]
MIVIFWGRHYSAFVHRGDARNFPEGAAEAEATAAAPKDDNQKESEEEKGWGNTDARPTPSPPAEEDDESMNGDSQEPWDPETWNGDVDDLHERLEGFTMHHELKLEIQLILQNAEPIRQAELLTFLVNSVSTLSLDDQIDLLNEVKTGGDEAAARRLQQKHQIPAIVLKQWQQQLRDIGADDRKRGQIDTATDTNTEVMQSTGDESYRPPDSSTDIMTYDMQTTPPQTRAKGTAARKRAHVQTPDERVVSGTKVRNKHSSAILKKGKKRRHHQATHVCGRGGTHRQM